MNTNISYLSRLLLPVRDCELIKNILPLVELVSKTMAGDLEKVDLLHVVGGSFLSTHLNNIDFRAGQVLSSELMQRLRDQHFQEIVTPMLSQVQELLSKSGYGLQANVRVEEGDPVKKISTICDDEQYSTLIVSRRKGEEEGIFTGTVLNGLIHRHISASFYIVGENGFVGNKSPAARIMVGIDGSPACQHAVQEAAILLKGASAEVEEISLVNVMDPSFLYDDSGLDSQQMSETGNRYLQEAEDILVKEGVDTSKITTSILFGKPGETLTEHARTFGATMCYLGRGDRSKIAEVLLGSVGSDVFHRCRERAIVLVN